MKDGMEEIVFWVLVIAAVALFSIGFNRGENSTFKDAIKAGAGYYTNNADGSSVFKWKECK